MQLWVATGNDSIQLSNDSGDSWRSITALPGRIQLNGLYVNHADGQAAFVLTDRGELWYFRDVPPEAPAQLP